MDFSVFNFKTSFTLHEAVCLTIGVDPRHDSADVPDEFRTAYDLLWEAGHNCAEGAVGEAKWVRENGYSRDELMDALLHPEWAVRAVRMPGAEKDPDYDFAALQASAGAVEEWKFEPWTIASWLHVRDVKPVYDFAASDERKRLRAAKFLPRADVDPVVSPDSDERSLGTRERRTLLAIIGALCQKADIDPSARGAAAEISAATAEAGCAVSDRTIGNLIPQIRDAMDSKQR